MRVRKIVLLIVSVLCIIFFLPNCKHEPYSPIPKTVIKDTSTHIPIDTTTKPKDTVIANLCSPDTAYFQNTVFPMILSYCTKSGCHNATSSHHSFMNYASIMHDVIPHNAAGSKIYKYISGGSSHHMPPTNNPQLASAQIQLINKWITQGAKNNKCTDTSCNTADFKYSTAIQPIMNSYCIGCHSGSSAALGVVLNTYSGVAAAAANGKLYGTVNYSLGFYAMPQGGNKLSNCQITKIKAWVDAGYPNN